MGIVTRSLFIHYFSHYGQNCAAQIETRKVQFNIDNLINDKSNSNIYNLRRCQLCDQFNAKFIIGG